MGEMIDKQILKGICNGMAYASDALAEIEVGDPVLGEPTFYSWINFNKKNKNYGYKAPLQGGPNAANRSEDTTWEGGTVREDQITVVTDDVTNATTGIRVVTETTTEVITLTTEEVIQTTYRPDSQLQDNWEEEVYRRRLSKLSLITFIIPFSMKVTDSIAYILWLFLWLVSPFPM